MEQILSPENNQSCSFCKKNNNSSNIFCTNCGYPMNGSEVQKRLYLSKRAEKNHRLAKSNDSIYWVTTILGLLSLLSFIAGLIYMSKSYHEAESAGGFMNCISTMQYEVLPD